MGVACNNPKHSVKNDSVTKQYFTTTDGEDLTQDQKMMMMNKQSVQIKNKTKNQGFYFFNTKIFLKHYDDKSIVKIGSGGSGVVFSCLNKTRNQKIALKIVQCKCEEDKNECFNEVYTQQKFQNQCENIVKIYEFHIITTNDNDPTNLDEEFVIEFECSEIGSLEDYLKKDQLSFDQLIKCWRDCTKGIAAIHDKKISHCDIKPQNILLFKDNNNNFLYKITDFGGSINYKWNSAKARELKQQTAQMSSADMHITFQYAAPEILMYFAQETTDISQKSDIFSLGLTFFRASGATNQNISQLYQILTPILTDDNKAFSAEDNKNFRLNLKSRYQQTLDAVLKKNLDGLPGEVFYTTLIKSMLEFDRQNRISLQAIQEKFSKEFILYDSGDIYCGEIKVGPNGKVKHGKGEIFYKNKNKFFGEFKDDYQSGQGEFIFAGDNQKRYIGTYYKDRYKKGRLEYVNGDYYDGNFEKEQFNGEGTFYKFLCKDETNKKLLYEIFKGNFLNGQKHGTFDYENQKTKKINKIVYENGNVKSKGKEQTGTLS